MNTLILRLVALSFAAFIFFSCSLIFPSAGEEEVGMEEESYGTMIDVKEDDWNLEIQDMPVYIEIEGDSVVGYSLRMSDSSKTRGPFLFAKRIVRLIQVIDQNGAIQYFDDSLNAVGFQPDPQMVCGTVPHYTMRIHTAENGFEVEEEETFYRAYSDENATQRSLVSSTDADDLSFINGEKEFSFTGNYGIGDFVHIDPRTILLQKEGRWKVWGKSEWYDKIFYDKGLDLYLTTNDGLTGVLGLFEPRFQRIISREHYILRVIDNDGSEVLVSNDGAFF